VVECHRDIIVQNVHTLKRAFDNFPKRHVKVLLGDFNAEVGTEGISKSIRNGTLREVSNDNGVRVVNFAT
jgi:hypothetical protein